MLNAAILGTGPLGLDLIERIQNSPFLQCALVVGRTPGSRGLAQAAELGCTTATGGIDALLDAGPFDVVFDATNAFDHPAHSKKLADTATVLVDLTPASVGTLIVPTVNGDQAASHRHIGLVSCGGQASLPVLHALAQRYPPSYVEVVATAATVSVGRASRLNLDEYVDTTRNAIGRFTGAASAKTMLNISAALPAPPFRIAMTVVADGIEQVPAQALVDVAEADMQAIVPGYRVTSCTVADAMVRVVVEVAATRGRIPVHAGNLEVISAAAIYAAEQHAAPRATKELAR
ncbi:acetylating acetaldehyde dehydrogenase [Streptomyces sp. NPDC059991]|uniref:acetylating acetaldehyde dehydrogenase n=1 Tax=Streptomyces sp. NPDC059991 TaxID=3347028 RepID=UPI00367E08CA